MPFNIGEEAHGGIVFYVDETGEHGKVAAPIDQSNSANWFEASRLCESLDIGGYADWYLPSKEELNVMYNNLYTAKLGGLTANFYWSSTEYDDREFAWNQYFMSGYQGYYAKGIYQFVRAIRAF